MEVNPKLIDVLNGLSIWKVKDISDEPETFLTQWSVWKVDDETIHFVGWAGYEGRVCSAVQSYDPKTKCGITKSGRIYKLQGEPGHNWDALHVWDAWKRINHVVNAEEITQSFV